MVRARLPWLLTCQALFNVGENPRSGPPTFTHPSLTILAVHTINEHALHDANLPATYLTCPGVQIATTSARCLAVVS